MATKFLESAGAATFDITSSWTSSGTVTLATDFLHGDNPRSISYATNGLNVVLSSTGVMADAGRRSSFYLYINALPSATATSFVVRTGANASLIRIRHTTGGAIQLWETSAQVGTDGPTLSSGRWARISLAYTITDSTHNEFRLFVNGSIAVSVTNTTLTNTGADNFQLGNSSADATFDIRTSDHYVDDSTALTDTGDIWVTAKRPFANGTLNNFSTQIGAGSSGYGSGHSSQVNERPLSITNGWSMIGAGSAVTEEYTVETQSQGDIDIWGARIIDFYGWVYAKSLISETGQIVVGGATSNISLTSTASFFTTYAGSTTYPTSGAAIGIVTDTTLTTVSLYECGVVVAYIPTGRNFGNSQPFVKVGQGMSRNERAT